MNSQYFIGHLLDFDEQFSIIPAYLAPKIDTKIFAAQVYSTVSQECIYQYDMNHDLEADFFDSLLLDSNIGHPSKPNISYHIMNENKMFDENFEILIFINSPFTEQKKLICSCYFSVLDKNRADFLYELENPVFLQIIETTAVMVQAKIASYDKLYYSLDFFADVLKLKDTAMPYHITNVANWGQLLAESLQLTESEKVRLYVASLFHDSGKIYLPDHLMTKREDLTKDEFSLIKTHAEKSADIAQLELTGLELFEDVPGIILNHHERYDGKGYPNRLKGNDIPYLSRILTVADAVDAMFTWKPYRKNALNRNEVIGELMRNSGSQFDPLIAKAMIKILVKYENNLELSEIEFTNYVAIASLSFNYKNIDNYHTFVGNLIVKKNSGQLFIHTDPNKLKTLDPEHIYNAKIGFYYHTEFLEFNIDIKSIQNNLFILNNFESIPSDKYFSVIWEVDAGAALGCEILTNIKILKIGGDGLVFEVDEKRAYHFLENSKEIFTFHFELPDEREVINFRIQGIILDTYDFVSKYNFVIKFVNTPDLTRDHLIKLLYRRQVLNKKNRNRLTKDNRF
jgi:HD-GYP domain-containing protein (c-di-GMP phosphodiesterase class II)